MPMRSPPMMAHLLLLLALVVLQGAATASSSSVAAFHGVHYGTQSARSRRRVKSLQLPFTKAVPSTPSSQISQRSDIMRMYNSKSDKGNKEMSKGRSWFKPWKWFARRQRRKVRRKYLPQTNQLATLLDAFEEAKDLGIIQVNDNDSDGSNTADDVNGTFPTQMAPKPI